MNSKLEQALIQTPRNSDAYQETLNIMYDYRTRNNAVKLLKKSKDLLSAWKHSHDSSAPAFEAAQQGGTRVDRFYRRKLLELKVWRQKLQRQLQNELSMNLQCWKKRPTKKDNN